MYLEQLIITFQIILIDIVMVADNAIIIGLIAANFATENRRTILAWGVGAAFIFRIFFATGANYIFEFAWVKILGGIIANCFCILAFTSAINFCNNGAYSGYESIFVADSKSYSSNNSSSRYCKVSFIVLISPSS